MKSTSRILDNLIQWFYIRTWVRALSLTGLHRTIPKTSTPVLPGKVFFSMRTKHWLDSPEGFFSSVGKSHPSWLGHGSSCSRQGYYSPGPEWGCPSSHLIAQLHICIFLFPCLLITHFVFYSKEMELGPIILLELQGYQKLPRRVIQNLHNPAWSKKEV